MIVHFWYEDYSYNNFQYIVMTMRWSCIYHKLIQIKWYRNQEMTVLQTCVNYKYDMVINFNSIEIIIWTKTTHFYAVKIGMSINLIDLVQNKDNWQAW